MEVIVDGPWCGEGMRTFPAIGTQTLKIPPNSSKAVILSHRPPISLARTTVSAALLEELLGEVSSLASVYHKPPETFIGKGRFGADTMQKLAE